MWPIRIDGHKTGSVKCKDPTCPFHEEVNTGDIPVRDIQGMLADAAMHAITSGHTVTEHISDDREVIPEIYAEGGGLASPQ